MTEAESEQAAGLILLETVDPSVTLDGRPMPALTALLYRVCDKDQSKFEEATRLVTLFIRQALKLPPDSVIVPRSLIFDAGIALASGRADQSTLDALRHAYRQSTA